MEQLEPRHGWCPGSEAELEAQRVGQLKPRLGERSVTGWDLQRLVKGLDPEPLAQPRWEREKGPRDLQPQQPSHRHLSEAGEAGQLELVGRPGAADGQ